MRYTLKRDDMPLLLQWIKKIRQVETCRIFLVGRGGFEPPKVKTDRFTVCCHWPLGNLPIWSWRLESNPQPADYKSAALPVELRQHIKLNGASGRNRTTDTGIFSPLLYRLSYRGIKKWRPGTGSNRRPPA